MQQLEGSTVMLCACTTRSYCSLVLMEACEDRSEPLAMAGGSLCGDKLFTLLGTQQRALSQDINLNLDCCSDPLLESRMYREPYILQEGFSAPVLMVGEAYLGHTVHWSLK